MSLETATRTATAETAAAGTAVPLPSLPPGWRSLPRAFVQVARANRAREAMSDSTGANLTFGQTLIRALALGRVLARRLGPEPYTGLLLPPTVPSAVANIALSLWGKIPVNLNYTASQALVDASIDRCGIRHVLTSQKVLDRFKIRPKGGLIFLEDIPKQVRLSDKLWAASVARLVPTAALGAFLPGMRNDRPDATATVIFTSGSTGDPKGVVLAHRNILANIHQIKNRLELNDREVVLGILPFFHSFGFTITIWTVLCLGKKVAYHYSPLDSRVIGDLCAKEGVTLIFATPTYMKMYAHKCGSAPFAALRAPILGAEKLKPELARELREAVGVEPLEGYGCTELSPVAAVNVPHDVTLPGGRTVHGNRPGTVGLPLPGTEVRAVDPETGADVPRGVPGMILIRGPQVMAGYLNKPEETARVLQDGWYRTGDLGYLDADGFLTITDRLSRFSKIGGEMVPHTGVEAAVAQAAGVDEQQVAVTALPDPRRGERLVVLYTDLGMPPEEVYRRLTAGPWPKLWLPSPDSFVAVEEIPHLGSGKTDLRRLREIARERLGGG